ncbi:hypothetical protein RRG08_027963 [Elysia crispata]|uniref:Uncharacterized protein n=1 Tax=Elysia crispata TaxID=231223 RepID=A0AAE0ZJG5_9GAST|nr:hypothetical protein RRG08_027963 [Elysia crispata]
MPDPSHLSIDALFTNHKGTEASLASGALGLVQFSSRDTNPSLILLLVLLQAMGAERITGEPRFFVIKHNAQCGLNTDDQWIQRTKSIIEMWMNI